MNFNTALLNNSGFSVCRNGNTWNAEKIIKLVAKLSQQLLVTGVSKGEKILLKAANGPEHFVVFLTCEKLELLYIPVFNEVTAKEFQTLTAELGFCREISFNEHSEAFEIKIHNGEKSSAPAKPLTGALFKTSGTTSRQKYIFHSFTNLWVNAGIAANGQILTNHSKILSLLTYSHMGGFCMQALPALHSGATVLIVEKTDYAAISQTLSAVTHSVIVPSMFRYLNEYCEKRNILFSSRPLIVTGSVPVGNSVLIQMLNLGFRVQVIYGLTEMGPYVSCFEVNSKEDLKKYEYFLGVPQPGYQIKLDSKSSEVLLDGPCKGLAFDPESNGVSELPQEGGWLRTGDAATVSEDDLYFTGRLTLTINVGGFKVSPQEIENVILSVPGVEACIVKGETHFALGEVPVAYVKSRLRETDIINKKIHENLARYKWPRKIVFVDNFTETSIGKTKRNSI
jgi:acyl-CoA synthetase (AMP-forming)/AMP-acid ligase II